MRDSHMDSGRVVVVVIAVMLAMMGTIVLIPATISMAGVFNGRCNQYSGQPKYY